MTAVPSIAGFTPRAPAIMWYSRVLAKEVAMLRAAGTEVLVVQPTRADLDVRRGTEPLAAIATQAAETVRGNLARPVARRAREILQAASSAPAPAR
jgi:hypothetical protein